MHHNEITIADIECKVTQGIKEMMQSCQKDKVDDISECGRDKNSIHELEDQINEQDIEIIAHIQQNVEPNVEMEPDATIENAEIDPYILEHVELMEYLYSSQGIKDMNDNMDEQWIPSFSLGIDDQVMSVCKDINKEHEAEAQNDDNDMVTPALAQQERRSKRETKLTAAYRSPYVQRIIDLNEKYSTQDYSVWRWLLQKEQDQL